MIKSEDLQQLLFRLDQSVDSYVLIKEELFSMDEAFVLKLQEREDELSSLNDYQVNKIVDYWYFARLEADFQTVIDNLDNMSTFSLLGLLCSWRAGKNAKQEYIDFARSLDSLLKKIWLNLNVLPKDNHKIELAHLRTINYYLKQYLSIRIVDNPMSYSDCVDYFWIDQAFSSKIIAYFSLLLLFYLICENLSAINSDESLRLDCYLVRLDDNCYYTLGRVVKGDIKNSYLYDVFSSELRILEQQDLANIDFQLVSKADLFWHYLQTLAKIDLPWRKDIYSYILRMFR